MWRYCPGMGLLSWASFRSESHEIEGVNFGDPYLRDLVVLDRDTELERSGECPGCGRIFSGTAVEIRDNRISRAWLHEPGEFEGEADTYLLRDEGELTPLPEWREHATPAVDGCSEWRLVVPHVENGFLLVPAEADARTPGDAAAGPTRPQPPG